MSFRNRLTLFFVLIVIVPMVAVAVVLFGATSSYTAGLMWAAGPLARYARPGRSSP